MTVIDKRNKRLRNGRFPFKLTQVKTRWVLASMILLAGLVTAVWLARHPLQDFMILLSDQERVSAYLHGFGALGPIVLAIAQFFQVLVIVIPGHVFLIAAGYVYGLPTGFLLNFVFVVVASQTAFVLARWAGRPLIERLVDEKQLAHWYKLGEERGFLFFTISFILPVFPTDLMNFVAGLTGISNRHFLAANALGRLPGVILLTLIGSHGLQMPLWAWGAIGLFAVTVYMLGRFVIQKFEVTDVQSATQNLSG